MATEAITLDKDAFMRLVTKEHLQVEGPTDGFLYTGKQGVSGWELYKTLATDTVSSWTYDATLNASSKTFTVPAGKKWLVGHIHGELTATATVGNRQLWITVSNGSATVFASAKTANIAATQVGVIELASMATYSTTAAQIPTLAGATPNIGLRQPMPGDGLWLPAGFVIRVYDSAAVDAAADDLTVSIEHQVVDL